MYQTFIGIDIGKKTFVASIAEQKDTHEFNNSTNGFKDFYQQYKNVLSSSLVVLETTGGYEMPLIYFLYSHEISVHRANTRKVKFFIRSLGQEAKTDAIDAQGLAKYGQERHHKLSLYNPCSPAQKQLQQLTERRLDLKQMIVQEKNRAQAPDIDSWVKKSCLGMIKSLEKQIKAVDVAIQGILNANPEQKDKQQVLKQVDGIGDVVSATLLALLPELGLVNRKQIASLVGLAPFPCESGLKKGQRRTKGGRQNVRTIIFMAAFAASHSKGRLGQFYRRLIKNGKKKMVAMTALMRKIIVIANAKLADWYKLGYAPTPV